MSIKFHAVITIAALTLTACSGGPSSEDDAGTLHRGNRLEPLTLDPHVAIIMDERTIVADMFAGLYEPGPDARPRLALAESADVSDDGLVWTFHLRDANWSDGRPITADDVVFGLQRALDPLTRNQYPSPLFMIANAEAAAAGEVAVSEVGAAAIDDRTVEVRLNYPAPYLPSVLMYWGQPVPRHVVEEYGDAWIRAENIVVSGAFRLVEWRSSDFIHLTANPEFFDAANVCLENVYFYPTVDTSAAERRVRNGELDLNVEFSGTNMGFLRERHAGTVEIGPGLYIRDITFNTARAPFDDARVRRALSMAIDRRFIADEVLAGADDPLFRLVPEGINGRLDGPRLNFADQDMTARREEAARLLTDAGFGPDNPFEVVLAYQPAAGWPRIAPVVQQDWAMIAPWVSAIVEVRDSQIHYDAMRAGDFEAATSAWVPDFDDPYAYLLQYESRAGEVNYSRWSHPEYDRIVAEALGTADVAVRAQMLAEAEQIFLDNAPTAPIFVESTKQLVGERVEGWVTNPFSINPSRWLCVRSETE
ncbi:peptide ABC transporter substrate-binding protein [Hyphobacterium marinum]|uniref:Peptide ABC transporter substrate-binding protein n=1 Tax=Hyphobacterium marinum TaxID=3116574 RepID=A0ABU7LW25_9PROT|nr:peptide ABC transporter substrate-binding protein [Hyphobacterium sp. Y6023]MEE2565751.1 peptide ABC transporter substrate-binding protein [Hyphobacterium sp. Y6023]